MIGGWAVYSYVQSLGSRDIDIVFPTRESKEKILLPYYSVMGYKEEGLFSKRFYKEAKTGKGVEKITLDACSLSDKNILHEDKNVEIPWNLITKHYKEWKIQKETALQVPQIELLLIYKIKALCDRRYDLRNLKMSMLDKEYIKSKIWKDEYDVNKLFGCKIDRDKLSVLLEATNFKSYFGRETERLKIKFL